MQKAPRLGAGEAGGQRVARPGLSSPQGHTPAAEGLSPPSCVTALWDRGQAAFLALSVCASTHKLTAHVPPCRPAWVAYTPLLLSPAPGEDQGELTCQAGLRWPAWGSLLGTDRAPKGEGPGGRPGGSSRRDRDTDTGMVGPPSPPGSVGLGRQAPQGVLDVQRRRPRPHGEGPASQAPIAKQPICSFILSQHFRMFTRNSGLDSQFIRKAQRQHETGNCVPRTVLRGRVSFRTPQTPRSLPLRDVLERHEGPCKASSHGQKSGHTGDSPTLPAACGSGLGPVSGTTGPEQGSPFGALTQGPGVTDHRGQECLCRLLGHCV